MAGVYAKIIEARRHGLDLTPDGITQSFPKYEYLSADAITTAARAVLAGVGLGYLLSRIEIIESGEPIINGSTWYRIRIRATWSLFDAESTGECIIFQSLGDGMDMMDNAAAKALTDAEKQFLLSLLMITQQRSGQQSRSESRSEHHGISGDRVKKLSELARTRADGKTVNAMIKRAGAASGLLKDLTPGQADELEKRLAAMPIPESTE